jgi:hypothetical protein
MRKIILLSLGILSALFLFGCTPATNSSILGVWQVTNVLSIPLSSDFYNFVDSSNYKISSSRSGLDLASSRKYSMSSNQLKFDTGTYDVYLLGDVMYWYQSNIEQYRLKKQ